MIEIIQPLLDWVAQNPKLAELFVFIVAAAESLVIVGIVVPGVVIMLGIGTLIGLNILELWPCLIAATLGAILGDGVSYWLGYHYQRQLQLLWPLARYPGLIDKGERFFKRHGGKSILIGRFVGPIRPIIPAVAGILGMSRFRFYLNNILSACLWSPVVILPGVAFGASLSVASDVTLRLMYFVTLCLLVIAAVFWIVRFIYVRAVSSSIKSWMIFRLKLPIVKFAVSIVVIIMSLSYWFAVQTNKVSDSDQKMSLADWQNEGWRSLPIYQDLESQLRPLNIQGFGELSDIQILLSANGWFTVNPITLENALLWFVPEPIIDEMPVLSRDFNGSSESFILGHSVLASDKQWVLRLWRSNRVEPNSGLHFWLGNVSLIRINPTFFGISYPVIVNDKNTILALLDNVEAGDAKILSIIPKQRKNLSVKNAWDGQVLLFTFHD